MTQIMLPDRLKTSHCCSQTSCGKMAGPDPKPGEGVEVTRINGYSGKLIYRPSVPTPRMMAVQKMGLVVLVGAKRPFTSFPKAPKTQLMDCPPAEVDPIGWVGAFVNIWTVAAHTFQKAKGVCVCPADPDMIPEAPWVVACLRGKLSGSKLVSTVEDIRYGDLPQHKRILPNAINQVTVSPDFS